MATAISDPKTAERLTPPANAPPKPAVIPAKRSFTWLIVLVLLVAVAVAGWYFWSTSTGKTTYVTATLDRGDIDSTVSTSGTLNAVITVQVGSQVSGNILALHADFNTKVKKGQLVAQIDPAPFQAVVDQVTGSLNGARAASRTAQSTLARAQSDVAASEANIASQRANVTKAQSAADLAKTLNDRRLTMVTEGISSREEADTTRAAWQQAVATVDAAKAAVVAAEAARDAARQGVDVARSQLNQSEASIQQSNAVLSQAMLNLSHTRILAPVDGTVQARNMDVGQTVAASFSAPTIFVIAQDLTKMQVDTNVDESDIGRIKLDQEASFTVDAWPAQVFRARVAQIRQAPINVANVITYDVVLQVSNPELKLFPGMTANATISVAKAVNALRVPKAALRFRPATAAPAARGGAGRGNRQGGQASQNLYVLDAKGQPTAVRVKLGISDASYTQVLEGTLKEGQQVVVSMTAPAASTSTPAPGAQPGGGGGGRRLGI